jgi:hypothetical protein
MIRHVVLFTFPPEVEAAERAELLRLAARLPQEIAEIRDFHLGDTFDAVMPPRWAHCMSMAFADDAALERYIAHPAHEAFRDRFRGSVHDRITHTARPAA